MIFAIIQIVIIGIASAKNISATTDFAIYDPSYEDDGVWEEEVIALKKLCQTYGWSYKIIDHKDLDSGILGSGDGKKFRGVIAPGGYAYFRSAAITTRGNQNIRKFVESGGGFVGFCAGAYWASETVRWDEYSDGKYVDYPYYLKLYEGIAKGPLPWMPWNGGTNINFDDVEINLDNPIMKEIGLPKKTKFLYGGGPTFSTADEEKEKYSVWARATENGEPTIIQFKRGDGNVILFSYHPDVLINSMADNVKLSRYYKESHIKWDLGKYSQKEINFDSWNIVHAALQVASNQKVTRIGKL